MGITGQTLNSGLLCDATSSWEADSKTCRLIHSTGSHASVLNDALVEWSLTNRGVVVGHVRRLEQGSSFVVGYFTIALTQQVLLISYITHHKRTTSSTIRRDITLPSIKAGSTSVSSLISIHLVLEHAQHPLCSLWFCRTQLAHCLQFSGRHLIHSVQRDELIDQINNSLTLLGNT